ncbi:MAG: 4-hydroxy-2-oxovalerate aldolase [Bacilli bacterium]|jgi:4-hydroxy 2-oxovalerate aldolase|nr:4-hydroxy-2-oxovalerate aldolase [Bacilli bacterium]
MDKITLIDTTMRDGSHAISHTYTIAEVIAIAQGLDEAGVEYIEIAHGDGIGGSTINYGFSKTNELDLIEAVCKVVKKAKVTILLIPGVGTIEDVEEAIKRGIKAVRVATHCTEADISKQHIEYCLSKKLDTFGFLMMSHTVNKEKLLEQALLMESYGAKAVYIADSAGYMITSDVYDKVKLLKNNLKIPIGFHAHNNLSLAIANSISAMQAGASYIDGSLKGLGAGSGNAQLEVLNCVMERYNFISNIKAYPLMDIASDIVEPIMKRPQIINTVSLMLGITGVYSSFMLHANEAAKKFDVDVREILVELGKRKMVGGQEDKIIEVAYELKNNKNK